MHAACKRQVLVGVDGRLFHAAGDPSPFVSRRLQEMTVFPTSGRVDLDLMQVTRKMPETTKIEQAVLQGSTCRCSFALASDLPYRRYRPVAF